MTCRCEFDLMPGGARTLSPRGLCPACRALLEAGDPSTRWRVSQLHLARQLYRRWKGEPYNLGPVPRPWPERVCDRKASARTRAIWALHPFQTPRMRRRERERLMLTIAKFNAARVERHYWSGMSAKDALDFVRERS